MTHTKGNTTTSTKGSEKWLLLVVLLIGLGGLLLSFSAAPTERELELEGIQLEGEMKAPSASLEDDPSETYVLR